MLKKLVLPLMFSAVSSTVFAQSTLNAANFNPVLGDAFAIRVYTGAATVNPGSSGPNIVWDFSTVLTPTTADTGKTLSCFATSPTCASFPGSNLIIVGPSVAVHARNYIATSTAKLSQVGAWVSADTSLTLSNPADQLRFPFTYGTSYVDTFDGIFKFGPASFQQAHHTGTLTVTCDAYGILQLPGRNDTGVLRVYSYQEFTDSVDVFGSPLVKYGIHSYDWYKPNYHSALLTIQRLQSLTIPAADQYFVAYAAAKVSGVADVHSNISELQVFPNPTSDKLTIAFNTSMREQVRVSLHDLLGREVAVIADRESSGSQQVSFNTNKYPPGVYVIRLQAGGETVTRKVTLE